MTTDTMLLTIPETADELRISRAQVYRLIQSAHLQTLTIGRSVRIPRSSLAEFVTERLTENINGR